MLNVYPAGIEGVQLPVTSVVKRHSVVTRHSVVKRHTKDQNVNALMKRQLKLGEA